MSGLLDYGQSLSPRSKTSIGDIQQRVSAIRSTLGRRNKSRANALKAAHNGFHSASNLSSVLDVRSLSDLGVGISSDSVECFTFFKVNSTLHLLCSDHVVAAQSQSKSTQSQLHRHGQRHPDPLSLCKPSSDSPTSMSMPFFHRTASDPHSETVRHLDEAQNGESNHSRARTLKPSMLHRAASSKSATKQRSKHEVSRSTTTHSVTLNVENGLSPIHRRRHRHRPRHRVKESVPLFLSKLQRDKHLRSVIGNVLSQSVSLQNGSTSPPIASAVVPDFSENTSPQSTGSEDGAVSESQSVEALHRKIEELESKLKAHSNTVSTLQSAIGRVEEERDAATKKLEELMQREDVHRHSVSLEMDFEPNPGAAAAAVPVMVMGPEPDPKDMAISMEALKSQNVELSSLADALALNLRRKEQSLEDALEAVHALTRDQDVDFGLIHDEPSKSVSRSLTEQEIMAIDHSNVQLEGNVEMEQSEIPEMSEMPDIPEMVLFSNEDNGSQRGRHSFSRGIANKLRALSSSIK